MDFPIFPLNGAVLFPKTTLPLNIFEKRYISMVDYALANKRLIGMIQTKENGDLFSIGCLGKINSFNETQDGRYLISLVGVGCFSIINELKKKNLFRIVNAKMHIDNKIKSQNVDSGLVKKILDQYKVYINKKKINLNINELDNLTLEELIKFITMVSPFSYLEKQSCLESKNINDFANKLSSILEMYSSSLEQNKILN
tara:strand:- start:432 stop:1028 length:597 start_codon:yes stop_codon:yes gene_type:complete